MQDLRRRDIKSLLFLFLHEVREMGEIERKIWEEMQQNEDFRKSLNEAMRRYAKRMKNISFFSDTFRRYMEQLEKGEIEIY